MLAMLPDSRTAQDSGTPAYSRDESQFLQDVYQSDNVYGGAAGFGFDPRAHLTETSPLLTPENTLKLRQSWEKHWDPGKAIRVEKTPGHLLPRSPARLIAATPSLDSPSKGWRHFKRRSVKALIRYRPRPFEAEEKR